MTDQLISFETAKLAKEKGLSILQMFGWITKFYHPRTKSLLALGRTGKCKIYSLYYAPSQSLLQKWLREEHNLNIVIMTSINTNNKFEVSIEEIVKQFGTDMTDSVYCKDVEYDTYENALEAGLLEALKLIK